MLEICSLVNFGVGGLSSFLLALAKSFFIKSSYSAKMAAKADVSFFSGSGGFGEGGIYYSTYLFYYEVIFCNMFMPFD